MAKLSDEEKKKRKNAGQRKRSKALKELGFSRSETRSFKKAIEQNPDVLQKPGILDAIANIVKIPLNVLDRIGAAITGEPTEPPKVKRVVHSETMRGYTKPGAENVASYEQYVRDHPELTNNKAKNSFRDAGGSIGNVRANRIFREVHGLEKEEKKVTKIKYYGLKDYPVYGTNRWKQYEKARYIYLVQFEVEREGMPEGETEFMHIVDQEPLTFAEIKLETERIWDQANGSEKIGELYRGIRLIPESIELIRAIDIKK